MDHDRGGHGHGQMDGRMMKDLNLSDAQKQQITSINDDFKSKMEQLNRNDNMKVKDFRSQKERLESDRKARFESVLTADQKNKLATLKNNREDKDGNRNDNSDRMEKNRMDMQSQLGLTSDQSARMKADRENFKAKAEAIKNNTSLSDQQKKDQFMQLRQDREQAMKSYLNADQIKKLEEMKSKRWDDSKNK